MEYKNLGSSGLPVSRLSLGSWLTFGYQIGDDVAENLMRVAYDNGINFFDNAETYAQGKSEIVMGNILKKTGWTRDSFIVSSKAYFGDGGQLPTQIGLHRKHLIEACHAALRRLQVDYLDLYFCHRPDKKTPIEEVVWTMNLLINQGKILYWGTSEWSAQEYTEACLFARQNNLIGPSMEQPQYNMFHRQKFEVEFKQLYQNFGMGTTIWSPLASGVLTDKYLNEFPEGTRLGMKDLEWLKNIALTEERLQKVRELNKIALELNTSMAVMSIAWCLKNPNVSTVILGASHTHHLEENLKALEVEKQMTTEVMQQIENILENAPEHPMW